MEFNFRFSPWLRIIEHEPMLFVVSLLFGMPIMIMLLSGLMALLSKILGRKVINESLDFLLIIPAWLTWTIFAFLALICLILRDSLGSSLDLSNFSSIRLLLAIGVLYLCVLAFCAFNLRQLRAWIDDLSNKFSRLKSLAESKEDRSKWQD